MFFENEIEPSWRDTLKDEFAKPYFARLANFVSAAYDAGAVYPPREMIFRAFAETPFDRTRVVILGQDPYHEPGQARGLAFYVPPAVPTPPSLANIAKELALEFDDPATLTLAPSTAPDLLAWARQGVLLLNATLTVAAHRAGSHQRRGWEIFTDAAVRALSERREHLVFLLWGAPAQKKGAVIDRTRHLVLAAPHPSPLSAYRGFFGSGHFRRANDYLVRHGLTPIRWR